MLVVLLLGVLLWAGAHLLIRLCPVWRARLGRPGIAVLVLVALVLMVVGYRGAPMGDVWWGRSPMTTGINNLLVLIAVWLCAAGGMKACAARWFRKPVLVAVVLWAVAHLLVNGDLPSLVLFGGIGIWALAQMIAVARTEGWVSPAPRGAKFELMALAGTIIVYGGIAAIHALLGYPVFG